MEFFEICLNKKSTYVGLDEDGELYVPAECHPEGVSGALCASILDRIHPVIYRNCALYPESWIQGELEDALRNISCGSYPMPVLKQLLEEDLPRLKKEIWLSSKESGIPLIGV